LWAYQCLVTVAMMSHAIFFNSTFGTWVLVISFYEKNYFVPTGNVLF
jgi:hypothetical protein